MKMKRQWVHEVLRVYGDRLVDEGDITWLVDQIRRTMSERMDADLNKMFEDFTGDSNTQVE